MIGKETSVKIERRAVSPGHRPSNEQFNLYALIFCHVLFLFIFCFKIDFLLTENGENLISAQP